MIHTSPSTLFSVFIVSCCTFLVVSVLPMPAFSEEQGIRPGRDHDRRFGLGYNLDLFPTVISASAGHFGIAAQAWAGIDHVKVRIVGARMAFPDSTIGNSAFSGYELSVAAVIMDYVFGEGFSGFWIGTGIEQWQNSITHDQSGAETRWSNVVMTFGGGYIWKVFGNLFVEPWAGIHYITNPHTVETGADRFEQKEFQASASVKIGYFFDI